jgi:hypothetical protein
MLPAFAVAVPEVSLPLMIGSQRNGVFLSYARSDASRLKRIGAVGESFENLNYKRPCLQGIPRSRHLQGRPRGRLEGRSEGGVGKRTTTSSPSRSNRRMRRF